MKPTDPLPDWLLERVALDEVPQASQARVAAARTQASTQVALEKLRADDADLLGELPPQKFAAEVRRRAGRERPARSSRLLAFAVPAFAAVGLCIFAVSSLTSAPSQHAPFFGEGGERVKGLEPALVLYRKHDQDAERLAPGAAVRTGDVLQLRYVAAQARQGMVFSVDGSGQVTLHWPLDQRESSSLVPGAEIALPHAYQLDQAPRFERFYFVTSNVPFSVDNVLATARAAAERAHGADVPLLLPPALQQTSFVVAKVP